MPSTVFLRMTQETSTTSTAIQISHGTCRKSSLPIHSKLGIVLLSTVVPFDSRYAAPRNAVIVPSVTTNGLMSRNATITPFTAPITSPDTTNTGIDHAARPPISDNCIPTTADTARIEPTDKSMPAVSTTKVMPAASTRLIATCRSTFIVLAAVAKFEVPSTLKCKGGKRN